MKLISIAQAPGKVILSGEHAVVYGKPAIALAINCFAETKINSQSDQKVSFSWPNLNLHQSISLSQLKKIETTLLKHYQDFLQGNCAIQTLFKTPLHLLQFTLSHALNYSKKQLAQGLQIHMTSGIPTGCGMGSSAAIALSLLGAINDYFKIKLTLPEYYKLGCTIENLQHGYSSGVDIDVSLHGGAIYFTQGHHEVRPLPEFSFYLVNTGKPATTTGECVTQVAQQFRADKKLWDNFAAVTDAIDKALYQHSMTIFHDLIQENHRLLMRIGVVPERVQDFITDIEHHQGAAKVCGAGAIAGETAGIVLVLIESPQKLVELCDRYHYKLLNFRGESNGLRIL